VALSGHSSQQLVRLTQAQLDEAVRLHALFREGRSGGRRAVVIGHDLSGLRLAGADMSHADLTGSSFFDADLHAARFDCATLFACDFRQANLENTSMARADLRGCFFAGAVMVGANLFEAYLRPGAHLTRDKTGEFRTLVPREASGTASSAGFTGANLTNASLAGAVAVKTDFSEALMRGCKLVRAHVRGANFTGSNLQGADFAQADTRDACFRGAVIAGAKFEYTDMAGADLRDTLSDKPNGRLIGELDASLEELLLRHREFIETSGATGAALDLSGFDLRTEGALTGACLTMMTARHAVFYGLDLSRAALQAARCAETDFRDCRFDGADMRGIVLSGAMLSGASMQGANLHELVIDNARRMQSDLSGASLRHADLRGVDLRGVLLAGADLSFANLTGADLTGVDLAGVKLSR
jgi:uncharacterized protein YjbI with pentapeptide repeats